MKYFASRNEFFQKPNFEGILENKDKFSVNLRKVKRQAGFENYRKSTTYDRQLSGFSVPDELVKIEKKLGSQAEIQEKLLLLLGIAVNGKVENANQALVLLIDNVKEFRENIDEIPIELVEGLVYNLKLSNKELQENTIIYIDSIFLYNKEHIFRFSKTKLFQSLIELLRSSKGLTLSYTLNIIFNCIFSNPVPITLLSQLLTNLFYVLENKKLATLKNIELVIFIFKQVDFRNAENELALKMAEWVIKFLKSPQFEIVQVSVATLATKLIEKDIIMPLIMNSLEDILNLLDHCIPYILSNVLLIVQIITAGSDENTQILLNLGILDKFVIILNNFWSPCNRICFLVAQCISNILAGTENQILFVLSYPSPIINSFIQQHDKNLYREGLLCCLNIINQKSKKATLILTKTEIILNLLKTINIRNDEDSLEFLKKINTILKKIENLLDGNDWIDLINSLRANNIYEKIEVILQDKSIKNEEIINLLENICKIILLDQPKSLNLTSPTMFNFS